MTTLLDLTEIPAKKENGYELTRGEYVEGVVIKWFQTNGLYCFKPNQPELKGKMLTVKQMDAVIQMSPGMYQRLEVKGRSGNVWRWKQILVGDVSKWDVKNPEVSILVVVEEESGEARFCLADKESIKSHWVKTKQGYKVPREQFRPLEALVNSYEATRERREALERELRLIQKEALEVA